jgi:prepilin-type N-terminal cleavage/methylation domain-containing protein
MALQFIPATTKSRSRNEETMPMNGHRRRAFSLMEILVAVALMVVLAAIVIPTVSGRVDDASNQRQASTLTTLAQATMTYHDQVGMWPSSLTQLTTAPTAGATNLCGNTMAAKDVARWLGPYVNFPISGNIAIEGNTILAALVRNPAASASPGVLQIQVQFPTSTVRAAIQTLLDTDSDPLAGVIQWTGSDPTVTMTYNLPITGC